jgi:hypothetical protein
MKRLLLVSIGILFITILSAQEEENQDWNIDDVFNEPAKETPAEEPKNYLPPVTVNKIMKQRGITFNAYYEFIVGGGPGWYELPWNIDPDVLFDDDKHYLDRYIKLNSSLIADAQIDDSLRIITTFNFEIPYFAIKLGDFFFDYNINDKVFFRGGKYGHSWGSISNYAFTNLLARVPRPSVDGDSFIFKIDIPTGIGGFQILALTRYKLMTPPPEPPELEDFGFGGKYNLALKWADFDTGVYFQEGMPLRAFLSIKTNLWNTQFYTEGLAAFNVDETDNTIDISGAASFGFTKNLFNYKFTVNGEIFYNDEKDSYHYNPKTLTTEVSVTPFVRYLNFALNLSYRFGGETNPSLFAQMRYAPFSESMQLIPGFRIYPLSHIEVYLAVPMTLGPEDGYYYKDAPYITDNKGKPIPFNIVLFVRVTGNMQFKH